MSDQRRSNSEIDQVIATYRDSPELLSEIFAIFLDEAPQRLQALQQAVAQRDFDSARRAAHSLANTTGTLRADEALKAARAAESAARSADGAGLKQAVSKLVQSVGEVVAAIEAYRSGAVD